MLHFAGSHLPRFAVFPFFRNVNTLGQVTVTSVKSVTPTQVPETFCYKNDFHYLCLDHLYDDLTEIRFHEGNLISFTFKFPGDNSLYLLLSRVVPTRDQGWKDAGSHSSRIQMRSQNGFLSPPTSSSAGLLSQCPSDSSLARRSAHPLGLLSNHPSQWR